ncbi:MAG: DUF6320 domain-containing protein [Termitinemataceae bacterium]
MKHCPYCVVIVRETDEQCPLCGKPTIDGPIPKSQEQRIPGATDYPQRIHAIDTRVPIKMNATLVVELISVFAGIALVVTILANLFADHALSWSWYAAVGILMFWLVVCIPLILRKHPWIIFAILGPAIPFLIFLLDVLDGHIRWFLTYGLPITLFAELAVGVSALLIGISRRKGLNIFAILLLGATVLCLGIEGVIDLNIEHRLSLDWSVIVSFVCVPMAGILFYLHYRIMKTASLRKLFRI